MVRVYKVHIRAVVFFLLPVMTQEVRESQLI